MTALLAWVWAPLLLYVLCLGAGLLTDSLLRTELPGALLPPVGLAVAIVLVTPGYRLGLSATAAVVILLLAAVAGFVVARRSLRERVWVPPALMAGGATFALYLAPVVLSGDPTFAGYNFVNDTASNLNLITQLEHAGATVRMDGSGASLNAARLLDLGYPVGSFSVLATLRPVSGVSLEAIYQPVMAMFAAFTAMSLTELGRRSGLRPAGAVAAACLALGAVLLYRYVLHGAVKEIAMVSLCATSAALAAIAVEARLPVRLVALVAVSALAMVLVFSAAAGAHALALGAGMLIAAALSRTRPSLGHIVRLVGVSMLIAVVVLLPMLGSTLDFADTIRSAFSASDGQETAKFGQLLRPLPITEVAGVWIGYDYRLPASQPNLNAVLVTLALVLAVAGVVLSVHQRKFGPLLLLWMVALPALALSPAASPYIDGKLLVIGTPAVVFLAALAALKAVEARRRPVRVAGFIALIGLGAGVGLSDLYGYREVRLAPVERVASMKDVAAAVPDRGLYLLNEWEEYGKYFMRSARVNPASEAESLRPVRLRRPAPIFGRWFDLDRQELDYVQGFAGVIMRRSPIASRPPASFRMIYRNDYYELWRRDPDIHVKEHLPVQGGERAAEVPRCGAVKAMAARAKRGDRLVAAGRPDVARLSPFLADRPLGWRPRRDIPRGTVIPANPGSMTGSITAAGERRVWLEVTGGRPLAVLIDGRRIGEVQQVNTPDQWVEVGRIRLRPGAHRIELRRDGGSWPPGDSFRGHVGPLALESVASSRLVSVPTRDAAQLCGRSWDWIELVGRR